MNLKRFFIVTILIVFSILSCNTVSKPLIDNNMVFLTNQHRVSVLPTSFCDFESIITQIITGRYSDHEYVMQTFLSLNPYEVSVTAMTPMGNTVYDLTYNDSGIEYNALMDIGRTGSAYMVLDIQLCYYPVDVIKTLIEDVHLTFIYEVRENGWKREIIDGDKTVLTIIRDGNKLDYNNVLRDYSYVIEEIL